MMKSKFTLISLLVFFLLSVTVNAACSGEIEWNPRLDGDKLKVDVIIKNTGTDKCKFKVCLYDKNDEEEHCKTKKVDTGKESKKFELSEDVKNLPDGKYRLRLTEDGKPTPVLHDTGLQDISHIGGPGGGPGGGGGGFEITTVKCTCQCYNETIKASAAGGGTCYKICGSRCGARAGFAGEDPPNDCKTRCDDKNYCLLEEYSLWTDGDRTKLQEGCKAACEQRCGLNSLIIGPSGFVPLLRYGALLIATAIFAVCGLKFLLSDDPDKRTEAKKCFLYVIAGTIIVGAASIIPEIFLVPGGAVEPRLACSSCEECNTAIEAAVAGELVILTKDIEDHGGACITWENDNVRFTCNGHVIDGTGTGIGISISNHKGNRISNCRITDFGTGIKLNSANENTISYNPGVNSNTVGIRIESSEGNKIEGNEVCENTNKDISISADSTDNTGDNNKCDNVDNWKDASADEGCVKKCAEPEPGEAPVADFEADKTSGPALLEVKFTDKSANDPTSWSWDFGDGGTSTEQNPTHEYTAENKYTVKLTVTNAEGSDDEEKTDYITVGPAIPLPEIASFTITDPDTGAEITEAEFDEFFEVTSEVIDHSGSGIDKVEAILDYPDGRDMVYASLTDRGGNTYSEQFQFTAGRGDSTGDYEISINATDNNGGITTSASETLTVTA